MIKEEKMPNIDAGNLELAIETGMGSSGALYALYFFGILLGAVLFVLWICGGFDDKKVQV